MAAHGFGRPLSRPGGDDSGSAAHRRIRLSVAALGERKPRRAPKHQKNAGERGSASLCSGARASPAAERRASIHRVNAFAFASGVSAGP
ncbi:hypothetical protein FKO59_01035 [Burkholderia pseudomallei]|nr:hypothetical protein FKO42_01045 [Burkholderia pseudomallei]QDH36624.1 hypothetical protein FKO59_01035 [Burkholderia pseudomallei]